jgi:hypothetical protein
MLNGDVGMMSDAEIKEMLDAVMQLSGEEFKIIRGDDRQTLKGVKQTQKVTNCRYVQFYPGTDVKVGDTLIRIISNDEWTVVEIDPHLIQGKVFCVNAYYETKKEQEKQQPQSVSYTFHNSSNIIAGSQAAATITVNIGKIESEIETHGGADKDELLAMVREIKEIFEKQDTISKSSLSKFSETLEKHSWITGSLVKLLGSVAIQFFMK